MQSYENAQWRAVADVTNKWEKDRKEEEHRKQMIRLREREIENANRPKTIHCNHSWDGSSSTCSY
jgi:hypothetical protein